MSESMRRAKLERHGKAAKNAPSSRVAKLVSENIKEESTFAGEPVFSLPNKQKWMKEIGIDFSPEEMTYLRENLTWGWVGGNWNKPYIFIPFEELTIAQIRDILILPSTMLAWEKYVLLDVLISKINSQEGEEIIVQQKVTEK